MFEVIDRKGLKQEMKDMLRQAQVHPLAFAALYLGLNLLLDIANAVVQNRDVGLNNPLSLFVSILTSLLSIVLLMGFILYCMTVRQGQRAEFLTLFDGFSFVGKAIGLAIVQSLFISLWSLLFVVPGIIAAYRYRFAYYNLCENPQIGILDALEMSKRQTAGYKSQLLLLDLSYLGWIFLSSLPMGIWMGFLQYQALAGGDGLPASPLALISSGTSLLVNFLWGLWSLAVSIFYLPAYQCTELGYYEAAKRTSGISPTPVSSSGGPNPGIDDYL